MIRHFWGQLGRLIEEAEAERAPQVHHTEPHHAAESAEHVAPHEPPTHDPFERPRSYVAHDDLEDH